MQDKYWLGNPFLGNINKIHQLRYARKHGIEIPPTIITSRKSELISFWKEYKDIIIKPLFNVRYLDMGNKHFTPFTQILKEETILELDEFFMPSLIQKKIDKQFEIRSFFIEKDCYSMAIFSQEDEQTTVDFRRYNDVNPNRTIPYQLENALKEKLIKFMGKLNLNTGSIDLIFGNDQKFYFLEVNPVGQFGMTSFPCNYYLEKKIAEFLILKDREYERRK